MKNIQQLFLAQAQDKSRFDRHIRDVLGQEIDPALVDKIAFFQMGDNSTLVISVGSSGWATRIRFFCDQIQRVLQNAGLPVRRVNVSVHYKPEPGDLMRNQAHQPRAISESTLGCLSEIASSTDNPDLQQSLNNLITRARSKPAS